METTNIKLFLFGCWNSQGCRTNEPIQKIMTEIKAHEEDYLCGIILGDNVYPQNSEPHSVDVLNSGIQCINQINKPCYVVLGNHDVTQCEIIRKETETKMNWIFKKNFYSEILKEKIKLIVIDTNLLVDPNVYKTILPEDTTKCTYPANFVTDQNKMISFIKTELSDADKYDWIIISGHYPIAGFMPRKDGKGRTGSRPKMENLFELIKHLPNVIYVSADIHNFQYDIVSSYDNKFQIHEIIVGTGGGKADIIVPDCKNGKFYPVNRKCKLKMIDTKEPYGYVSMTIQPQLINFSYNQIYPHKQSDNDYVIHKKKIMTTMTAGSELNTIDNYYNKYIKYKLKYLDLKNTEF